MSRKFALLLLFAVGFSAVASGARAPRYKQAIVIVLDAARPDHFSCYGYPKPTTPEMDKLAGRGVIFREAYAQGTETRTSLPRLLFSRYFIPELFPNHHSIPFTAPGNLFRKVDDRAISLPRALEARGVVTAAVSAHEWITEQSPFAREFTFLFDLQSTIRFDPKYAYPRADKVVDKAIEWIGKNRRRDYFLYLHIMDTHFPHLFEEDAAAFYGPGRYEGNAFHSTGVVLDPNAEHTPADKKYLDALYDGGLRYADREIGRLVAALQKWGRLDETLVIVTADHGEYLLDRKGLANHGGRWYEPLARVPLILHYPATVAPEKRDAPAGFIDIAPTVLSLFGIPLPNGKSFDGKNLFGEDAKAEGPVFSDGGVRDGKYKLVFKASGASALGEAALDPKKAGIELYDLESDPAEARDLAAASPLIVEKLLSVYREKLRPLYARHEAARTREQPRFSFAISAPSFAKDTAAPNAPVAAKPSAPVVAVPVEENPINLIRIETASGWLSRSSWDNSWLFAKPGAGPLKISLPLPNGKYFVVADIWGEAEIEIEGRVDGPRIKIQAAGADSQAGLRRGPKPVDIGVVDVTDEKFVAVIRPAANADPLSRAIGRPETSPNVSGQQGGIAARVDRGPAGGANIERAGAQPGWFAVRYIGFDPIINGKRAGSTDPERDRRLRSLGYIK